MKLREILKGKNNVRIKEYERYGNELIFPAARRKLVCPSIFVL